jgi:hypothetical protein
LVRISPRQTLCLAPSRCLDVLRVGVHVHGVVFVGLVVRARDEDPTDEAPLGKDPLDQLIG